MTAYEDTVELTGKGNVENNIELSSAPVEITGKGAAAVGLAFRALAEITGKGAIWSLFPDSYLLWQYRKPITITNNTGSALSNHPELITLTPANFDYLKCKNDGGDIRFAASDGETALSYWIEEWNYNGTSKIWVEIDSIPQGSNVCLYIYYENADATGESNGGDTFLKYDGFEDGDTTDAGDLFVTSSNKASTNQHRSGAYSMKILGSWAANGFTQSVSLGEKAFGSISIIRWVYLPGTTGRRTTIHVSDSGGGAGAIGPYVKFDGGKIYAYNGSSWVDTGFTFTVGWHRVEIIVQSSSTFDLKVNDESWVTGLSMYHTLSNIDRIGEHGDGSSEYDSYRDDYCVREYASPDPTHSIGEEEVGRALTCLWTLFQSAEIEGKGEPTFLFSLQPLLELTATGSISTDITWAQHELLEFTGVGDFLAPHVHIFADLDSFLIDNFSIRKTIQDPYWKFKGDVDNTTVPAYFKTLRIIEPDHEGTDRCIFLGFIPGAGFDLAVANDKATLNGFDQAWYLQAQYVPTSLRVTDEDTNPASIINTLLGNANWANETGIEPYCINTVTDWSAIKKSFIFDIKATKWKAIQEICAYCHHVFLVKWQKTADNQYYSCAYFVHEDELDDHLDLPDMATITNPDAHLISRVKKGDGGSTEYPVQIEEAETEKFNRITVSGIDIETGTWYHKTVESPGVISGDEIPIEFKYESSDLNTQVKVDALANALYDFYHTIAKYYFASFNSRMDFELYQKLEFVGFDDIPDELMRITGLTFDCQKTQNIVTVLFTSDQKLSDLRKLLRSMGRRYIPDWLDLAKIAVGTILEISESGKTALVQIDRDDTIVRARILNP